EQRDLFIDLARLGIQMRRDEIELFSGGLVRTRERQHAHRYEVLLVMLADGGHHQLRPLAEDVVPFALAGAETEPLAELDVSHSSQVPAILGLSYCPRFVY